MEFISILNKVSKKLKQKKKNFFTNSHFSDGENIWNVEDVILFAKSQSDPKKISLDKIKDQRKYWQGDKNRMKNSDTSFPLLIIVEPDGELSVADGLNRLEKAITIENKKFLPAYIVSKKDILFLSKKIK